MIINFENILYLDYEEELESLTQSQKKRKVSYNLEFVDMSQQDHENLVDFEEEEQTIWLPSSVEENIEKEFEVMMKTCGETFVREAMMTTDISRTDHFSIKTKDGEAEDKEKFITISKHLFVWVLNNPEKLNSDRTERFKSSTKNFPKMVSDVQTQCITKQNVVSNFDWIITNKHNGVFKVLEHRRGGQKTKRATKHKSCSSSTSDPDFDLLEILCEKYDILENGELALSNEPSTYLNRDEYTAHIPEPEKTLEGLY